MDEIRAERRRGNSRADGLMVGVTRHENVTDPHGTHQCECPGGGGAPRQSPESEIGDLPRAASSPPPRTRQETDARVWRFDFLRCRIHRSRTYGTAAVPPDVA